MCFKEEKKWHTSHLVIVHVIDVLTGNILTFSVTYY